MRMQEMKEKNLNRIRYYSEIVLRDPASSETVKRDRIEKDQKSIQAMKNSLLKNCLK